MDKTSSKRQERYREQISKGTRRRLQIVLDLNESERLDEICSLKGINKTQFVRHAIEEWSKKIRA